MKPAWQLIYLLLLFFSFNTKPCYAQDITINEVLPPEENSWGTITSMTQDHQGYMWFGSTNGLFRYNGLQTKVYQHDFKMRDNEVGNPKVLKINFYYPFFTTKLFGQGPGFGLSLSYDIIT